MTRYVYISIAGENRIAIYTQDRASGRLQHQRDVGFHGGPGPMATHPQRHVLYAALRAECEVVSLRVDPATGGLTQIGSLSLEEGPTVISTDRSGRWLLAAHNAAGAVSVNPIDADGIAVNPPVQWEPTTNRAHYVQVDAGNRFAFVPHVLPGNAIYQFHFDEETGRLTPNTPHVQPPEGQGPRHFCFHPNGRFLFTANEDNATVTAYGINAENGTLSPLQTVSTVAPEGYVCREEAATCAQIRITPDGRFLYAPTRGTDKIACFRVDDSGHLATIGYVPTERHTRGTAMDPDGRFFYATGLLSGCLTSFAISRQTGALEPLESFELGESPMWVEIVDQ